MHVYNIHNDWLTYFILANYGLDDGLFSQTVAEVSKIDFTKTKTSDLASIFELTVQIAITTHKQPKKRKLYMPCALHDSPH